MTRGEDEEPFFTGDAYSASQAADHFTNYNAELYWVSSVPGYILEDMAGKMTVSFTLTLDATTGVLTGVALNFVTDSMIDQTGI